MRRIVLVFSLLICGSFTAFIAAQEPRWVDPASDLQNLSLARGGGINGSDGQILMALALGFDGCVSGNSNVVPELIVALYQAVTTGDLVKARVLQQKLNQVRTILGDGGNLSLFKGMLAN